MSIKWMMAVWDHAPVRDAALTVLLSIADQASDQGVCWPSINTLAGRARVTTRHAKRLVQQLERAGLIEVKRSKGGRRPHSRTGQGVGISNVYTLTPVSSWPKRTDKGAAALAEKGDTHVTLTDETVTPMSPEPSEEPSEEPSSPAAGAAAEEDRKFLGFMRAYPNRGDDSPKAARKAWDQARAEGADADRLIEAATNYAALCRVAGRAPQYIKRAAGWLAEGYWLRDAGGPETDAAPLSLDAARIENALAWVRKLRSKGKGAPLPNYLRSYDRPDVVRALISEGVATLAELDGWGWEAAR